MKIMRGLELNLENRLQQKKLLSRAKLQFPLLLQWENIAVTEKMRCCG